MKVLPLLPKSRHPPDYRALRSVVTMTTMTMTMTVTMKMEMRIALVFFVFSLPAERDFYDPLQEYQGERAPVISGDILTN